LGLKTPRFIIADQDRNDYEIPCRLVYRESYEQNALRQRQNLFGYRACGLEFRSALCKCQVSQYIFFIFGLLNALDMAKKKKEIKENPIKYSSSPQQKKEK